MIYAYSLRRRREVYSDNSYLIFLNVILILLLKKKTAKHEEIIQHWEKQYNVYTFVP